MTQYLILKENPKKNFDTNPKYKWAKVKFCLPKIGNLDLNLWNYIIVVNLEGKEHLKHDSVLNFELMFILMNDMEASLTYSLMS